jgi:hypothetical protein
MKIDRTITFEECQDVINSAEAELGRLSHGQKVDLLADNFPAQSLRTIRLILDELEHKE